MFDEDWWLLGFRMVKKMKMGCFSESIGILTPWQWDKGLMKKKGSELEYLKEWRSSGPEKGGSGAEWVCNGSIFLGKRDIGHQFLLARAPIFGPWLAELGRRTKQLFLLTATSGTVNAHAGPDFLRSKRKNFDSKFGPRLAQFGSRYAVFFFELRKKIIPAWK